MTSFKKVLVFFQFCGITVSQNFGIRTSLILLCTEKEVLAYVIAC